MENTVLQPSKRIWDWQLFGLILAYAVLPSLYITYSLYLIGNELPNASGLAVAAQWQFVQIVLEVVQEATVLPIFFFVGSKIDRDRQVIIPRLKTSLVVTLLLSLALIGIVLANLDNFVSLSGADLSIRAITREYLSLKIWASLFSTLNVGVVIALESLNKKRILLYLILLKVVGMIFLDSLFFGGYSFSLGWGIRGAAYSNLIMEFLIFTITFLILLRAYAVRFIDFIRMPGWVDLKLFSNIGIGSGVESLIKNVAYFFLIIKLINELGPAEISGYYLSMHIFWSFLLVPVLAAVDATRALISNYANLIQAVRAVLKKALTVVSAVILLWILLIPFWKQILMIFNRDQHIVFLAYTSMSYLILPYVLLAFNFVLDSLFYGLGKTQYMAWQALLTNGTVYLIAVSAHLTPPFPLNGEG
ncbi:MAG TPA: MATE family efflux transporter [Flavilitoribacter sp.]|nr:MATE family efflux transporter [Flavilitoribacter sp.]HMQ88506.1 MATE family efflux transporter [Flavilitoribacter sp.]